MSCCSATLCHAVGILLAAGQQRYMATLCLDVGARQRQQRQTTRVEVAPLAQPSFWICPFSACMVCSLQVHCRQVFVQIHGLSPSRWFHCALAIGAWFASLSW